MLTSSCVTSLSLTASFSIASVPDGPGKGTMDSLNARKVAQYLIHAESLSHHTQPFSWLLIRPPLAASTVCCKACVCHRMQQHCRQTEDKVSTFPPFLSLPLSFALTACAQPLPCWLLSLGDGSITRCDTHVTRCHRNYCHQLLQIPVANGN